MKSARHRTAIRRRDLSRPVSLALTHQVLTPDDTFFDFGCGRGDDVDALSAQGIDADGWDPVHRPEGERSPADVVNLGYVVNVIESTAERDEALRSAWKLAKKCLVVAARLVHEIDDAHVAAYEDGFLTRKGTFQKFFEHHELGSWVDSTLGVSSIAAAPGVYYVFRNESDRQSYLSSRFRRPVAVPRARPSDERFEEHRSLLEPLMDLVAERGRLPTPEELDGAEALGDAFGSLKQAFRVVLWVTDQDAWNEVRRQRSTDLLVHIALDRFHGRPRFSDLPDPMQRDVRAFFSSYKAACQQADTLLFSAGDLAAVNLARRASLVGKSLPDAIYVHESALPDLPALLRVYEGCARAFIGTVEGANVIKLSCTHPRISYAKYTDFDKDPHPRLEWSVAVDLQARDTRWRDNRESDNPPILHRKELLVNPEYPGYEKFTRLTKQEERWGLYADPSSIGRLEGWHEVLESKGARHRGHRLVRERSNASRAT